MNRKTIIACVAALAVLVVLVVAAVAFLYSGTGKTEAESIASESKTGLLAAVPSDAVMVVEFPDFKTACSLLTDTAGCFHYFSGSTADAPMLSFLETVTGLGALKSARTVLSMHYNGSLVPLLALDSGRAGEEPDDDVRMLMAEADSAGLTASFVDCSGLAAPGSYLSKRNILLISTSDVQPKSSERHIGKGFSVLDSEGFSRCASRSSSGTAVFILCKEARKFISCIADRSVYGYSDFLGRFADWAVFSIAENSPEYMRLDGSFCFKDGVEDFASAFRGYSPAGSDVMSVLPSYTIFFASLPFGDVSGYIEAADAFADGTGRLGKIETARKQLQKKTGVAPVDWARTQDIKEVAAACFRVGDSMEKILLMRVQGGKKEQLKLCQYAFQGYAGTVFGPFFSLEDESSYTYVNDWMIVGSSAAISEYVEGRALENTLGNYISDASIQPESMSGDKYFIAYLSASEDAEALRQVFKPYYASSVSKAAEGYSFVPAVFSVGKDRNDDLTGMLETFRVSVMKSKAPVFERDTVVVVPKGPFKVKNSGTGKMNLFEQQDNMYLCLKELDGKGIWGVPFSTPICGCAGTIDYFANGKLQILFASGSKLYLIDRLGRYVSPFPVDLGKEILVGPGIYDFNGTRKYNVMILHKDNTIEMYNLQGRRPAQWKTITSDQTIKSLPEAIKVGGKTYWVVRTSIQTLIFGFYGGEPLTVFEGDRMIRSDSKITPGEGASVKAVCYDGKTHTIKLQ